MLHLLTRILETGTSLPCRTHRSGSDGHIKTCSVPRGLRNMPPAAREGLVRAYLNGQSRGWLPAIARSPGPPKERNYAMDFHHIAPKSATLLRVPADIRFWPSSRSEPPLMRLSTGTREDFL